MLTIYAQYNCHGSSYTLTLVIAIKPKKLNTDFVRPPCSCLTISKIEINISSKTLF